MTSPWHCEVCDRAIRPGTGFVEIVDRPVRGLARGYPRDPTPEPPPVADGPISNVELAALALAGLEPRIAFRVAHHDCDPDPDGQGYWIAVERAATLEAWVSWALHVGQKCWMGQRDILSMLHFWFANRGQRPPDLREVGP